MSIFSRLTSGPLLSERIQQTGGRATGFDYMRLLLAVFIICYHSIVTCYGSEAQKQVSGAWYGVVILALLPMFFALSGFLVAGSLERSKGLGVFLGLRALRIFPALTVDTLFSVFILGAALTTLPLSAYFTDSLFYKYFLNIAGIIQYYLPGVFENNPSHKVNGQLWTIPFELECYIVLTLLAAFGLHKRRHLFLLLTVAIAAFLEFRLMMRSDVEPGSLPGRALVICFLSGVSMYLYRDRIRWSGALFVLASIATALFLLVPKLAYFVPFTATYMTVYLGLQNPKKWALLETGDYSYGLFLYGYPLQQALVATVPFAREWWGNLLLAIPLAFVFAALSWHLFEKRALTQKHHLYAMQGWWSNAWLGVMGRFSRTSS